MTANHIMIDFETMGYAIDGKLAFVGFTVFDPYVQELPEDIIKRVQEVKLNWAHDEQSNYKYSDDVLDFWSKQPLEIKVKMLDNPDSGVTITEFCNIFGGYLQGCGFNGAKDIVWARGTNFDITILERIHNDVGLEIPFPWYRVRDVRTFVDALNVFHGETDKRGTNFIGKIPHMNTVTSNHDAAFDIANDIINIQTVVAELYNKNI